MGILEVGLAGFGGVLHLLLDIQQLTVLGDLVGKSRQATCQWCSVVDTGCRRIDVFHWVLTGGLLENCAQPLQLVKGRFLEVLGHVTF